MGNRCLQFWPFLVVVFRHERGQIWFWSTTRLKALRQCSKTWGYSFPTPSISEVMGNRFLQFRPFLEIPVLQGHFSPWRSRDIKILRKSTGSEIVSSFQKSHGFCDSTTGKSSSRSSKLSSFGQKIGQIWPSCCHWRPYQGLPPTQSCTSVSALTAATRFRAKKLVMGIREFKNIEF